MNETSNTKVVTRFAPSPTGFLHVGSARTALYSYLFARKYSGTFILRIEDTDKAREVDGAIRHIQDSLGWLGIEYDFGPGKPGETGPYLQSDRLDIYKVYAQKLIDKGLAYPDPYTEADIATFREQAKAENRPFLFRQHRPEIFMDWDGTRPLRFKTPEIKRYEWDDAVRGKLSAGEEMLDDFILIKADGYPTYNFAHIVDDTEMGVTHVMRGEEFISSTPKFLSLYDALKIPYPIFATLPPIMAPDGKKKLSKRDGSKDLLEYKTDGYLPEAMRNFLAMIGWNPGGNEEIFPGETLIEKFSIEKIQRSGGAFNEDKLRWMNQEYLRTLDHNQMVEYVTEPLDKVCSKLPQYSKDRISQIASEVICRAHNKLEIEEAAKAGEYDWAFAVPEYETDLLKWKNDPNTQAAVPRLQRAIEIFELAKFDKRSDFQEAIMSYAEEVGKGELLWPLRVALSGKKQSPDPFTLAITLGKDETISRIKTACDKIQS